MRPARLIVNADDFGMSRGVTDGIILAHRYGVVTSASLMANMPAAEYALARADDLPRLGVGIHLNICQGRPILSAREVRTLVDARGRFHPPAVLRQRLWTWRVAGREIEAEFRAQIRWMKERGVVPTHADSHQHMHIYPPAVFPFRRALAAEGIHCARAPHMSVWPRRGPIAGAHAGDLVRRILAHAYRRTLQSVAFRRFDMPDSRIAFLASERRAVETLGGCWKAAIAHLPGGAFELACHPGLFEPGFSETDAIRVQRELELQWLIDPEFRHVLDRSGVQLISYRDLRREPLAHAAAEVAA